MFYYLRREMAYAYAQHRKEQEAIDRIKYGKGGKKPTWSTSKKITTFLIANFVLIELYSLVVMYMLQDLTALSGLIASTVGEVVTFCVYSAKSCIENKEGGIVFEQAKANDFNNDAVG